MTTGDSNYNIAIGSEAHFSVRADKIQTGAQKDMANRIIGKYLTTEFIGSLETDVFEVAPNHFVHVVQHRESTERNYSVGDQTEICWPANEGVLFKNT